MLTKKQTILTWNPSSELPREDSELLLWDGLMFHSYFYYGKVLPECVCWAYLPQEV